MNIIVNKRIVSKWPRRFLVADTQLYKRLCLSVGPLVRWSVGPSVREHESKSKKTSVLDAFCACEWRTWGVDGALMPLPTRPQRYCDPASLVSKTKLNSRMDSPISKPIQFSGIYFCFCKRHSNAYDKSRLELGKQGQIHIPRLSAHAQDFSRRA